MKEIHFPYGVVSVYLNSRGSNLRHNNDTYHGQSTGEFYLSLVAKIVGSSVLGLLCFSGVLWFAFRYLKRNR